MIRNPLYLITLLAGAALAFSSCESDNEPSKANKGKERPVVNVEIADSTQTEFILRFKASGDTKYVGYAVYAGGKAQAPSAYDILTQDVSGTVSAHVYESGSTEFTDTVLCVLNDNYQVFAAAMTESGLIGEVTELSLTIPGAHPSVQLKLGSYVITPSEAAVAKFDPNYLSVTSSPMTITLSKFSDTEYLASGRWFNLFNLEFIGTYDYSTDRLSFNGDIWYSSDDERVNGFGYIIGTLNQEGTLGVGLFGAGNSGNLPMVFQCEVNGDGAVPTSVVQGIELDLFSKATGNWKPQSIFGYFAGGETITTASAQ